MSVVAPAPYVVALVVLFGVRSWVQRPGTVPAEPHPVLAVVGPTLALAGFAATLAGQTGMGASWRIGVDPAERTTLVTSGVFAHIRNPISTAMALARFGMVLSVPTWLSAAAPVALITAVHLQVRAVEQPYSRRVHGDAYAAYLSRTGRFLPGVGRLGLRVGPSAPAR